MTFTPQQQLIADRVNARVKQVRPDLAHAHITPEQVSTQLARPALSSNDVRFVHGINDIFRTMPEPELGRIVRLAEKTYNRYLEASQNPSAALLHTALVGFQAAVVGYLRGGSMSAQRSISEAHAVFDREILLVMNGEITVRRAEAEAGVVKMRAQVADLAEQGARAIETERLALQEQLAQGQSELAAERAALQDAHDMALQGLDEAQRDASEYRRQLDAASAQLAREREAHAAEIARLTATLDAERRAVVARERDTRNRIQQLEQDARSSASVIASLNAECERLEALTAPPLEVLPMTQTAAAPTTALERASLTAFLRVRLQKPALNQAEALAPLAYDHHWAEWRAAYPTADSQKKQLARAISKKAA